MGGWAQKVAISGLYSI